MRAMTGKDGFPFPGGDPFSRQEIGLELEWDRLSGG